MLNFIYYPVSAILWFWWKAFGYLFGTASGITWTLAVVFLIFTLRAILFKPFVSQVRSMRKMQEFAPEIQKLKKKYGNDKQRMTQEMQKLQSEHGVNPLGSCLPVLVQIPVFIGLFQVLREFQPYKGENYVFGRDGVVAFNEASLFGAKLGAWVTMGEEKLAELGTTIPQMLVVMIPLMIAAGIFTHVTARHSIARQTEAQAANPQAAIMNKLMLYIFPIGVVVGAPFLPLAILIYWVANNLWTLGQQWLVYRQIAREDEAKLTKAVADRQARAPRPGQKPARAKQRSEAGTTEQPTNGDTPPASPAGGSNGAGAKDAGQNASNGDKRAAGSAADAGQNSTGKSSTRKNSTGKNSAGRGTAPGKAAAGGKPPAGKAETSGKPAGSGKPAASDDGSSVDGSTQRVKQPGTRSSTTRRSRKRR